MARTIVALAVAALLAAPGGAVAVDGCIIVGGPQAPVLVRVYESDPYRARGGRRLFIGFLNPGERHRIASKHGRIWYAYRWHEGDSWKEGYEASCRGGERVELP
jgi:hypothetical protein